MNNNKFFIVLPSDSSTKVYPENKTSSYTTNLPNEIRVDPSKWKVPLKEITFRHTVCPEKKYTLSKRILCLNKRFLC